MTKLEVTLGLILAAVIGFGLWLLHHDHLEIQKGETRIERSDAKALQAASALADAQSKANQHKADLAAQGAINAQQAVDTYRAAHPDQPVLVCHPNHSDTGMQQSSTLKPTSANPGAGPASDSTVQERTAYDIGPGLALIVSVAQQLAITDAEWQHR